MYNAISLSLGELVLKGKNRGLFEQRLNQQIKAVLQGTGVKYYRDQGKVMMEVENDIDRILKDLQNIFGIVVISPCVKIATDLTTIKETIVHYINDLTKDQKPRTFKIDVRRANKSFPIQSPELNKMLGGVVLENFPSMNVDVHHPDVTIFVDIRKDTYIYSKKIKGAGGLPAGSNGQALVLLSGGIDSPVAAYMMARRGVKMSCITFHAYPFTSQRANDKVANLTQQLTKYCGDITLYSVNLLEIYKAIKQNCPEETSTIIARRMMMRISQKIAEEKGIDFLVTGENLGQVASQTTQSLIVVEESTNMMVLRPLIALDKNEIIEIAKRIETFDISIQPYEDCCSVFSPPRPVTKPKLDKIMVAESNLEMKDLIDEAIHNVEIKKMTLLGF